MTDIENNEEEISTGKAFLVGVQYKATHHDVAVLKADSEIEVHAIFDERLDGRPDVSDFVIVHCEEIAEEDAEEQLNKYFEDQNDKTIN